MVLLALTVGIARAQMNWEPVHDLEREMVAGIVDPKAGAEALFLKVRIEDSFENQSIKSVLDQYIRIKVFSEAEGQRLTAVRIPHAARGVRLSELAARTILADGTVLDVAVKDMKDVSLARSEGREWKALSFAMPRVGPGSIIEYRWRETRLGVVSDGLTIDVQRDLPIRRAEIDIKPLELTNWQFQIMPFSLSANVPSEKVLGWYRCTAENVRAVPNEPYSPPGRRQRGFVFAYYLHADINNQDVYWASLAAGVSRHVDEHVGAKDEIAAIARSVVADADADSVKLQRLVRWCRRELRDLTPEEYLVRTRSRPLTSSDVLASRAASEFEAASVLAALAKAAGLQARIVLLESRDGLPYRRSVLSGAALSLSAVSVDQPGVREICVPRGKGLRWDELPWQAEGMRGITCSVEAPSFVTAQVDIPSTLRRVTDATLLPNGDIEGVLRLELSGHWAQDWFDRVGDATEREEALRVINRWGPDGAKLGELKVAAVGADSDTVVVTTQFRWPGFATVTGKRVLLQPALWSARAPGMFPAESRQSPVMFPFSWGEWDSITFHLPAGFRIEAADEPQPFEVEPLLSHSLGVDSAGGADTFVFLRRMRCATPEHTSFPRTMYADVRQAFQSVAGRDQYTLTLTRTAP